MQYISFIVRLGISEATYVRIKEKTRLGLGGHLLETCLLFNLQDRNPILLKSKNKKSERPSICLMLMDLAKLMLKN